MTMTEVSQTAPTAVVFTARSTRIRQGDVLSEAVAHSEHPVRQFVVDEVGRDAIYYAPDHEYIPVVTITGRDLRNGQTVKHTALGRRRWLVSRPIAEAMR
jgi:hypothetical protein